MIKKINLKNRLTKSTLVIILGLLFGSFSQLKPSVEGYKPKDGFVPNDITAIKIAEAIWLPIYGVEIYNNKPFKAKLINGKIWRVYGTIYTDKGGTAIAEIQKSDGKVILISHGK